MVSTCDPSFLCKALGDTAWTWFPGLVPMNVVSTRETRTEFLTANVGLAIPGCGGRLGGEPVCGTSCLFLFHTFFSVFNKINIPNKNMKYMHMKALYKAPETCVLWEKHLKDYKIVCNQFSGPFFNTTYTLSFGIRRLGASHGLLFLQRMYSELLELCFPASPYLTPYGAFLCPGYWQRSVDLDWLPAFLPLGCECLLQLLGCDAFHRKSSSLPTQPRALPLPCP